MIKIKPEIQHHSNCPYCQTKLQPIKVKWHGMYAYIESQCPSCNSQLLESLEVSHLINHSYQVDLSKGKFWGDQIAHNHVQKLLEALENPRPDKIHIEKEILHPKYNFFFLLCASMLQLQLMNEWQLS